MRVDQKGALSVEKSEEVTSKRACNGDTKSEGQMRAYDSSRHRPRVRGLRMAST